MKLLRRCLNLRKAKCQGLISLFVVLSGTSCKALPLFNTGENLSCNKTSTRLPASLAFAAQSLAAPSEILYSGETVLSPDLVQSYEDVRKREKRSWEIQEYIPTNMKPTSDSSQVAAVIADKSLQTLMRKPLFKESVIGQAASSVEKTVKKEVEFASGSGQNRVDHKLNFQVLAFQSAAQLQYEGFAKAAVLYNAPKSTLALELSEKVFTEKELLLAHEQGPEQKLSRVSLRWNW